MYYIQQIIIIGEYHDVLSNAMASDMMILIYYIINLWPSSYNNGQTKTQTFIPTEETIGGGGS